MTSLLSSFHGRRKKENLSGFLQRWSKGTNNAMQTTRTNEVTPYQRRAWEYGPWQSPPPPN
jgi:hypothetical protein